METSIIIRVKNEKENLAKLLKILKNQTSQEFEVVIVNNNSTDGSDEVASDYFPKDRVRVINIDKFTYPKACNLGAEKAQGKYLVYLSAHSFPISNTWLADGLSNFTDDNIAGVFAYPMKKLFQSSFVEMVGSVANIIKAPTKSTKRGELGNTNSIIRRDLWEKHKFDESLIAGSEDYEWSRYLRQKGYLIVNDPKFRVYHSHHLGFLGIIKEELKWKKQTGEINKRFKT